MYTMNSETFIKCHLYYEEFSKEFQNGANEML